jgi:hypothetical protein
MMHVSAQCLRTLQNHGATHPTADTQGGEGAFWTTMGQMSEESSPGGANRVPERDRASVHINLGFIEAEFLDAGE